MFGPLEVLKGIDLEIQNGEAVALIGPNGCGKTTLMRVLATLVAPTSGDAFVGGYSVARSHLKVREIVGWVPASDGGFFPRLTGLENLLFFGGLRKISKSAVMGRVERWGAMEALKSPLNGPPQGPLTRALETPFFRCSSGMKQLLSLCRALLPRPRVLLLDEPTRSLDHDSAAIVRKFLRDEMHENVVFFATHSEQDALETKARRVSLRDGRVVEGCPT